MHKKILRNHEIFYKNIFIKKALRLLQYKKVYGKIIRLGVCLYGRLLSSILLRTGNFRSDVYFHTDVQESPRRIFSPVCRFPHVVGSGKIK